MRAHDVRAFPPETEPMRETRATAGAAAAAAGIMRAAASRSRNDHAGVSLRRTHAAQRRLHPIQVVVPIGALRVGTPAILSGKEDPP